MVTESTAFKRIPLAGPLVASSVDTFVEIMEDAAKSVDGIAREKIFYKALHIME
jgi:hypothetical protein